MTKAEYDLRWDIVKRAAELADQPMSELKIHYHGFTSDDPPTQKEIRACTAGATRGSLITGILSYEFDKQLSISEVDNAG